MKWRKYNESRKPGFGRKFVKESSGPKVRLVATIEAIADTVDGALEVLHQRLLNTDAEITDGNENPNSKIVDKYNYWNGENEGDVEFRVYGDEDFYDDKYYREEVELKNIKSTWDNEPPRRGGV